MGSAIYYRNKTRLSFINWLANAKIHESYTMEYDIGFKHKTFFAIMGRNGKAKVYNVNKYAWKSEPGVPTWLISKDSIKWVLEDNNRWNYTGVVVAFIRLGLIPKYNSYYKIESSETSGSYATEGKYALTKKEVEDYNDKNNLHRPLLGDGIEIQYLRRSHVVNFNGTKVVPFKNMEFDWNGNLLTKRIPKKSRDTLNAVVKENKDTIARQRRANAANVKVVYKLRKAQETGDYSNLCINDIWYLTNVTHRTELINHFGMENIVEELDYYVKHKNTINGNEYELLSVKIPDLTPNAAEELREANYLKMINPTTGETHIEGVANFVSNWNERDPINSVGMALAWRNGDTDSWNEEDRQQVRHYIAEGSDIDTDLYAVPRTIT